MDCPWPSAPPPTRHYRGHVTKPLQDKTIVITGASSGIGAAAARRLAERGARVVAVGRNPDRTRAVAESVGTKPLLADFGRFADVRRLAADLTEQHPVIDVLVHNAGGVVQQRQRTEDGHELTLQANYLAPFLLQHLLHEQLSAARTHVVVTSSAAHRTGRIELDDLEFDRHRYAPMFVYGTSKLADLLFARALARRAPATGITAVAFHPGIVRSAFADGSSAPMRFFYTSRVGRLITIDNEAGAEPLVHLAGMDDAARVNGQYFNRMAARAATSRQARDVELGEELWARTVRMLDL